MKSASLPLLILLAVCGVEAYVPKTPPPVQSLSQLQKVASSVFAAAVIAGSSVTNPLPADASSVSSLSLLPPAESSSIVSSTQTVAAKVVREGIYGEFSYDMPDQKYDDARSTFKAAKETKSKKGKYTAILAVLIVGSFVVPMAQYFWYVRDDETTDNFFGSKVEYKEPEQPKKKKGWF